MSKYALEVKHVSKSFRLPTEQASGIKQAVLNQVKGIKGFREQKVLEDISFKVEQGDFFGIVGRNGSGKSTLLKLISQIYTPDSGEIKVQGKLVPFIELGVGFNPELTGRENVYMNGALLGFSTEEVNEMYEDIVDFAELSDFMDQKLKNYSSGMQVRLAFSIAIKAQGDILVLDEVLAVGDEAFQRKCFNYFAQLKKEKKTVILVTHSMDSIQQFCNKAILIDKAHKLEVGNPLEIAQIYRELNSEQLADKAKSNFSNDKVDVQADCKKTKEKIFFNLNIISKSNLEDAIVTVVFNRDNGEVAYRWASDDQSKKSLVLNKNKNKNISLEVQNIFPNGIYDVQVAIKKRDRTKEYAVFNGINKFEIVNVGPHWHPQQEARIT